MKSILRVVLLVLVVLAIIGPSTFAQTCTPPPPETIALTWPPLARILVLPDINSITAAQTAMTNWNNATFYYCYAPVFTFSPGTGQQMTVDWVTMPPNPNGTISRGKTFITTSGRIVSATTWLSNAILQTFPATLAEVMAHEIGHTMGLNDCDYPGCGLNSSVMENLAPVPIWATEGQPGPTPCDLAVMSGVATDYGCPPPPPPDRCCQCRMKGNQESKGVAVLKTSLCCTCDCPIIIDTSGNGFDLTSAASGVKFDMSGTASPVQMSWTAPDSQNAFLCLPDSNGACDDGKDLFGNFTPQPPTQTPNGFLALAVYDLPVNGGNGDGIIDSRDAIFSRLRLWIDRNHDGISQPDEIYTLPALGVYSISLNYKEDRREDQYGNLFRYRAQINPGGPPGSVSRTVYDVFLLLGSDTITAQQSCPAPQPPRLLPEGKDVLK